mgnify:FL=1
MLSRTYHLKFPDLDSAQVAAPYLTDTLGEAIPECDLAGLTVLIGKEGDISVNIFFPGPDALKAFEKKYGDLVENLKKTFLFKSSGFDGVCIFNFDASAEESAA